MFNDADTLDHLSQVISHVIAPSFLLGGVISLVTLVFSRMSAVVDRLRELNAIPEKDKARAWLREDLPRQRRLLRLLRIAAILSLASGVATALLIITGFTLAILGHDHAPGMAYLFILAMLLFIGAIAVLAVEAVNSVSEFDHHHGSG
ncbi:DUF2721 domain-containing protein [Tabrizicola sp. J26]|uniref:DUF2721 domain-containing protein n=1 Tax=Alitabrizicola rongguiensis TaxID=2909234 RepID=UPI001F2BABB0|nr:DUF2721 domain-containing protein [Tabrizicola rongguiensis]MCF1710917.1 DUF2721 domain-containing protein [Tabrizicola rongguiensis]